MVNIEELIQKITKDAEMRAEKAARAAKEIAKVMEDKKLQAHMYRDEPILKTAAQMENYLPTAYREMRNLAHTPDAYRHSEAWLFYHQGKLMEEHADDFVFNGSFQRYFPTYRAMNDQQLRGYFSWRTAVRRGEIKRTETSFAFVYIYELLHCIGADTPLTAFYKLQEFLEGYREYEPSLERYLLSWLRDFVVYYGLDSGLLNTVSDTSFDQALLILLDHRSYDEDALFGALCVLSSYSLQNSAFYKQYPKDVKRVTCAVFDAFSVHHETRCKNTLCERLFGRKITCPYTMFASAVFYDRMKYTNYSYQLNPIHAYSCRGGNWMCEKYYGNRGKNKELGKILKTVDRLMRQAYAFPQVLKDEDCTKLLIGIVTKEIDAFLKEKKMREARTVKIDLSKLQGIRVAADETRDKLLIEQPEETACIVSEETEQVIAPPNDTTLSDAEYRFMQCLLYGGDYMLVLQEHALMVSMVADSVNEKLFDLIGDTAVDFDNDIPFVIEDYVEELKGWIHL